MMSMTDQIAKMRRHFPQFKVVFNGGWWVEWQGPLRPFGKTYVLRIVRVENRMVDEMHVLGTNGAHIFLVDPQLVLALAGSPDEPTPHVYWNASAPERSRLCVFDPVASEWTPDMAIADTIVPWTIDWLASYEGWLATGEWTGGGRHPEVPDERVV